jgi:mannose-6-phosphate isomerase-like protein (cupin superfamily)
MQLQKDEVFGAGKPVSANRAPDAMGTASPEKVRIIRRSEMPFVSHVVVDGVEHLLGQHRDLRRNEFLASFMPEQSRLGIAWVHLKPGEILSTHVHPIESMILICEGEAEFIGDFRCSLAAGDIVAVPRGAKHGFRGTGAIGFHGLSIQFEQRGLYEDPANALVNFLARASAATARPDEPEPEEPSLHTLLRKNEEFVAKFHDNLLFKLMSQGCFEHPDTKRLFFDYFQRWSNHFQRAMLVKTALCEDPAFVQVFRKHFAEELNHDQALRDDRKSASARWDAVLEAVCAWFPSRMLSSGHEEQIVIMNMVVEAVAIVFYHHACPALDPNKEMSHFHAHDGVDVDHQKLGLPLLENLSAHQYARLLQVQAEAWSMSEALFRRLGELTSGAAT